MPSITRYTAQTEIARQSDLSRQLLTLQQQVSTGKRLTAPSDDPAAAARIAAIRQTQADQVIYTTNTNTGTSIASAADTNLSSVASLIDNAKGLLLSGSSATTSDVNRATIASQIAGLVSTLQGLATANDPTGAPLFPTGTPLQIPVSDTQSLPATASRDSVFNQVTVTTPASGTTPASTTVMSLADILTNAAAALQTTDPTQRAALTSASLTAMSAAADHIAQVRADQGVREQAFTDARTAITNSGETLATERSTLEDTDLTYALSQFQANQLSLQAAQSVFAQSMKSSLFDLIG